MIFYINNYRESFFGFATVDQYNISEYRSVNKCLDRHVHTY